MQVKVFDEEHEKDLEEQVNSFIKGKTVIDIKYQVSVAMYLEDQIYCYSAMIMYENTC